MYPSNTVVARSIALGEPVIFVSANYRLNGTIPFYITMLLNHPNLAFGFLGGKEVQAAKIGNTGLRDRTPVVNAYIIVLC